MNLPMNHRFKPCPRSVLASVVPSYESCAIYPARRGLRVRCRDGGRVRMTLGPPPTIRPFWRANQQLCSRGRRPHPSPLPPLSNKRPLVRTAGRDACKGSKGEEEGRGVMQSVPRSEDSDAFLLIGRSVDPGGKHVYPGRAVRLLGRSPAVRVMSCQLRRAAPCALH